MITRTIKIGDKDVTFGASAGTARRYRIRFGGDLLSDMQKLDVKALNTDVLEKLAYIMASQVNEVPEDINEWLDQFGPMDLMNAYTEIINLWAANAMTTAKPKKK